MNPCEFAVSIATAACAIANNCSEEELAVYAAAFAQLGDTLATILAKRAAEKDEQL
jgi:hypothetical protein